MNILGNFKGTPWDYQEKDAQFAYGHKRVILGHKTGLGKTFIALNALARAKNLDTVLIVASNSSLPVWMKEVPRWTEAEYQYISKDTPNKNMEWYKTIHRRSGVFLINHTQFRILSAEYQKNQGLKFKKPFWDAIIIDEAHKLKNRDSQLFDALKHHESEYLFFLSATPASRGAQDLWSYLHLINKGLFSSYWRFVNTFCWVNNDTFGKDVFGTRNPKQLRALLKDYYRTRTYEEVKPQLPPLRRQLVELVMGNKQRSLYKTMEDTMILSTPTTNECVVAPGSLPLLTRLRQLALCPRMFDDSFPLGVCLDTFIDDLMEADLDSRHTVVFSEYTKVLNVLAEELSLHKDFSNVPVFFLEGGMKPGDINAAIDGWKRTKGILLCVISCAQSFALDTVRIAYVIGSSFDPIVNIQAEGRLRRADSNLPPEGVLVKYLIPSDTKEMLTKEILNGKVLTVREFLQDYGK